MIELKPIKRIMSDYLDLLKKYNSRLNSLDCSDFKRMIGEIKLFWYRNAKYVDYCISHITEEDEVAFLAGAMILDIAHNGHYEYIMAGKTRLINDPFLKMETILKANENEVDHNYLKEIIKESMQDLVSMLVDYPDDFYVIPLDPIKKSEKEEFSNSLINVADKMVLAMFSKKYNSMDDFYKDNNSYEDIEKIMIPFIKENLIINSLEDRRLSLREKCNKYFEKESDIAPFYNMFDEGHLFYYMVLQYCMQTISIIYMTKCFHMTPFIRNDITFQYYCMIYHTNLFDDFSKEAFMKTYILYVIQKTIDFSCLEYNEVRRQFGNSKLINDIMHSFRGNEDIPRPKEVIECANIILEKNKK